MLKRYRTILNYFNYLFLKREFILESFLNDEELRNGIKQFVKNKKNIRSEVSDSRLDLTTISGYGSIIPAFSIGFDLLDIKTKLTSKNLNTEMIISITFNKAPKLLLIFGIVLTYVGIFYLNYFETPPVRMFETPIPWVILPFAYFVILVIFIVESNDLKSFYQDMIAKVESRNRIS